MSFRPLPWVPVLSPNLLPYQVDMLRHMALDSISRLTALQQDVWY